MVMKEGDSQKVNSKNRADGEAEGGLSLNVLLLNLMIE